MKAIPLQTDSIEINDQFRKALDLIEKTHKNVFITGRAGTGKSTLLTYFRATTQKRIAVLAPTGVAALNVRGETIHSFFRFKPDVTLAKIRGKGGRRGKSKIYKKLDAIVIDEASMVRADLLDCVDAFLRLQGNEPGLPFGGIQMVFIGDLYQLPPVVTERERDLFRSHYPSPYFFDAKVFEEARLERIELEKVYRQKDADFIHLLNAIRNNSITHEGLAQLNARAGAEIPSDNHSGYGIHLTTTNAMAAEINSGRLRQIKSDVRVFTARITGDFDERSYPADKELQLAAGAQVMFLNNDAAGRWVNGSLGQVKDFDFDAAKQAEIVWVELENGEMAEVSPYVWELFHFKYNESTQAIETETVGTYAQYPLKLSWAITIHKSQGKTFERVVIDMGTGSFASGQTYVALSRCTSLEGIVLRKPLKKSDILMDRRVVQYMGEDGDSFF